MWEKCLGGGKIIIVVKPHARQGLRMRMHYTSTLFCQFPYDLEAPMQALVVDYTLATLEILKAVPLGL